MRFLFSPSGKRRQKRLETREKLAFGHLLVINSDCAQK